MSLEKIKKITRLGFVAGRDIALVTLDGDSKRLYYRSTGTNRGMLQEGRWCRFKGINLYDVCTEDGHCFIGNLIKPSSDALMYNTRCKWYTGFLQDKHGEKDLEYAFEDNQDVFVTSVLDERLPYSLDGCDEDSREAYSQYSTTLIELYDKNDHVKEARSQYKKLESQIDIEDKKYLTERVKSIDYKPTAKNIKKYATFMADVSELGDVKLDYESCYISRKNIEKAAWAMTFENNIEEIVQSARNDVDKALLYELKEHAKQYRTGCYMLKCAEFSNQHIDESQVEQLEEVHKIISRCVGKSGPDLIDELRKFQQEQLQQEQLQQEQLLQEKRDELEKALVGIEYIDDEWGISTILQGLRKHKDRNQFIRDAKIWLVYLAADYPELKAIKDDEEKKYIYYRNLAALGLNLKTSAQNYVDSKKDYKDNPIGFFTGRKHHPCHDKAKEVTQLFKQFNVN